MTPRELVPPELASQESPQCKLSILIIIPRFGGVSSPSTSQTSSFVASGDRGLNTYYDIAVPNEGGTHEENASAKSPGSDSPGHRASYSVGCHRTTQKTDSSVPATSHNTRRKETSNQDLAASN